MSVVIRAANAADVALLAWLQGSSFEEKWNADAFSSLLTAPGTFALLAKAADQEWQGFVLARTAAGEAEILSLATAPSARRQGLARALVLAVAAESARRGAGEIFLEVSAANAPARALYRGLGFAEMGVRRTYYRPLNGAQADALILRTALPLAAG